MTEETRDNDIGLFQVVVMVSSILAALVLMVAAGFLLYIMYLGVIA